ncbi:MAG: MBL fold metallo-hydrolase [Kangiellaceae bacterium]|nr:MBL fold metallo-hydrolase [Kangiellaceae bacterium]
MKELFSILGNSQKLDGGAMFGNAPKGMWKKWVKVDEKNRIDLACRCLLIKETMPDGASRTILFEAGIGAFFEPKLQDRFGIVESEHVLLDSLKEVGVEHTDIDVIVLSHLHFDHIGGLLSKWEVDQEAELLFPNAAILVGKKAWQRALNPHFRDKASFIPHLINLLEQRDNLHVVEDSTHPILGNEYRFHYSDGHTPGMMLAEIAMPEGPIVFCADLIPGAPWVHLPITMGYDRYAEKLIDEKQALLSDLLARNGRLFFTHDAEIAHGRIAQNEKGKFLLSDSIPSMNGVKS